LKLEVFCTKCNGEIKLTYSKTSDNVLLHCAGKCKFQVGCLSRVKVIE